MFTVSGFEPDPTSIVSPSSFVALPLGAFLRQAALLILFNRAPLSPFKFLWVLRLTPKATLALLRLVDSGLAAHQTLFVHASLNLFGSVTSAEDF